jgi:glycosyltransferase involved in cell wall biosynthesis
VRRADLIITTTGPAAEALARRHPAVRGRIRAIPNGVDDDPLPVVERPDRFIIAYAGTIYLDRDPRPLFHGAARFLAQHHLSPSTCTIEFMGEVRSYNGTSLTALARETGVAEHLRLHPPQPRAEALRFLAGASVLVCLPQDSTLAIPAKLFEYLRFPAAVLALATQDSATGQLLGPSAADVVAPDDPDGIAAALARHYAVWASGRRPAPLADGLGVSRRALARDLFATVATLTKD